MISQKQIQKRMKYTLLFFFFSFSIFANANQVVFSGNIDHPNSESVNILIQINDLTREQIKYSAKLNENNEFLISVDIKNYQIAYFEVAEMLIPFFVHPLSKSVNLRLDEDQPNSYYFSGDNEADNNFYKRFRTTDLPHHFSKSFKKGYLTTKIDSVIYYQATGYMEQDYFQVIKEQFQYQKRSILNQKAISFPARQFFNKLASWHYETNKFVYFILNKDRYNGDQLRNVWLKYQLLQDSDVNDEKYLAFEEYSNMVTAFMHYLNLETPVKGEGLDYYRFINRNLSNKTKFYMMSLLMKNAYLNGASEVVQKKFKEFKRFNQYPEFTTSLESVFGGEMQFIEQKAIPNFNFVNEMGAKQNLSMFEGKPVYISFWASWCGPCLQNFKETIEIRKEMEKMGVVFLNVNLDDAESNWRETLPKYEIVGTNVYGKGFKDFQKVIKISALPHHIIKDKYNREVFLSSEKLAECKEDFVKLLNQ